MILVRTSRSLRNLFDRYWYFSNLSHHDIYICYLSRKYYSFPRSRSISPTFSIISYLLWPLLQYVRMKLAYVSAIRSSPSLSHNLHPALSFHFSNSIAVAVLSTNFLFFRKIFLPLLIHTLLSFDLFSSRHPNSPHLLSFPLFSLLSNPFPLKSGRLCLLSMFSFNSSHL